jgi:hypothetical protein
MNATISSRLLMRPHSFSNEIQMAPFAISPRHVPPPLNLPRQPNTILSSFSSTMRLLSASLTILKCYFHPVPGNHFDQISFTFILLFHSSTSACTLNYDSSKFNKTSIILYSKSRIMNSKNNEKPPKPFGAAELARAAPLPPRERQTFGAPLLVTPHTPNCSLNIKKR